MKTATYLFNLALLTLLTIGNAEIVHAQNSFALRLKSRFAQNQAEKEANLQKRSQKQSSPSVQPTPKMQAQSTSKMQSQPTSRMRSQPTPSTFKSQDQPSNDFRTKSMATSQSAVIVTEKFRRKKRLVENDQSREVEATTNAQQREKVIHQSRDWGTVTSRVQAGDNVMVRRRFTQEGLELMTGGGGLTAEQAKKANEIGRSQVNRSLDTATTGALLGADRDVIDKAIDADIKSRNKTHIKNDPTLIDATKDALGLPDIRGANVEDLLRGAGNIDVAAGDRSSAEAWRNFNEADLGKITPNEFISRLNPGMGQGGTGDGSSGAGDGSGNPDAELGGGFQQEVRPGTGLGKGGDQPSGSDQVGSGEPDPNGIVGGNGSGDGDLVGPDNQDQGDDQPSSPSQPIQGDASDTDASGTGQGGDVEPDSYGSATVNSVSKNADGSVVVTVSVSGSSYGDDGEYFGIWTENADGTWTGTYYNGSEVVGTSTATAPPDESLEGQSGPVQTDGKGGTQIALPANDSDDDAEDDNNETGNDDTTGGDQGYTPAHDDGMPAATEENLAWLKARQQWIESGLVNPGSRPAADKPDVDEIQQNPTSNPRQGWAINPGAGQAVAGTPTAADWIKITGSIGVADPPKPIISGGEEAIADEGAGVPASAGPTGISR